MSNQDNELITNDEKSIQSLAEEFKNYENGPDEAILEAWKETYGKFFVSSILGGDDIYVWRTLNRTEYKQLINSGVSKIQSAYEDAIVRKCILWPTISVEDIAGSDAGTIPTLSKQILFKSGFVSDQYALSLIKVI